MKIIVQEKYEDVLAAHWQKLHKIKELVDTDSGSELRARSIRDRRKELASIENDKEVLERLFDKLVVPGWYTDWIDRLKKYDDPFYRH